MPTSVNLTRGNRDDPPGLPARSLVPASCTTRRKCYLDSAPVLRRHDGSRTLSRASWRLDRRDDAHGDGPLPAPRGRQRLWQIDSGSRAVIPSQIASAFSPVLRSRGDAYHRERRVRVRHASNAVIQVIVTGTEHYLVSLEATPGELLGTCGCPFAMTQGVCGIRGGPPPLVGPARETPRSSLADLDREAVSEVPPRPHSPPDGAARTGARRTRTDLARRSAAQLHSGSSGDPPQCGARDRNRGREEGAGWRVGHTGRVPSWCRRLGGRTRSGRPADRASAGFWPAGLASGRCARDWTRPVRAMSISTAACAYIRPIVPLSP